MRPIARIVLLASAAILLAAAAPSKSITLERKVPKKAPVVRPVVSALFSGRPVGLGVVDARGLDDPAVVGAQKERGKILYEWTSTGPVPDAVSAIVAQTLQAWSVTVAPGADADVSLALKLTRYRVDEISETFGSSYRAEVAFHADVVSRGGEMLLSADATGTDETSGVDQRAATCNQVLTAALEEALMKIVTGTSFGTTREVIVAPAPAPPPPGMISPAELYTDLTRLVAGGVGVDVLVAYVNQRKLSAPLSADDILRWKTAGIPQAAIQAALEAR
jgi:hypothetical protein